MTKISRKSWHYWLYSQLSDTDYQNKVDVCQYVRGVLLTFVFFNCIGLAILALLYFMGLGIYYNYLTVIYFLYDVKWDDNYGATLFIDVLLLVIGFIILISESMYRFKPFSSLLIKKIKSKTCFYIDIE